jgi:hypothetical protein
VRQRELHQSVATLNFQLVADVRTMSFDRTMTDAQFVADFLTGFIFRDQLEDTPLGTGEIVGTRVVLPKRDRSTVTIDECGRHGWAGVVLTRGNCTDAGHDVRDSAVLLDITLTPEFERLVQEIFFTMDSQEDDGRIREALGEHGTSDFKTVHSRHIDI